MIERLDGMPAGVDGVRPVGTLTREDYETIVRPMLDRSLLSGTPLRVLIEVGPEFTGLTAGALWDDVRLGARALHAVAGCAVVSDVGWIGRLTRFASFLMPCPARVFPVGDREQAVEWLQSLPEGPGVVHELLGASRVVVIEVSQPLRVADFEAVAATVDPWLRAGGQLRGLVVHAAAVPGWENMEALVRHLRFVRDHHRRIRRVALAADGRLAVLLPALADHFVEAEVRHFDHAQLVDALAWAGA